MDYNFIKLCKNIVRQGIKEFYVNNILTPIEDVKFIEHLNNPFLAIYTRFSSEVRIKMDEYCGDYSESGIDSKTGRKRSNYMIRINKDGIETRYKFILNDDGDLIFPERLI